MEYYYYDQYHQRRGPVSKEELKELVNQGVIEPMTPMETGGGHKGTAGQIPDLFAPASAATAPPLNWNESPHQQHRQQETLFCSNCGASVHPLAVACPNCGVPPRTERHFCTNCGAAVNSPKQIICVQCGLTIRTMSYAGPPGIAGNYYDANALGTGFWDVVSKKYALIYGRARRREYWMFTLFQMLIVWVPMMLGIVFCIAYDETGNDGFSVIGVIALLIAVVLSLALLVPSITITVRRLHDAGYSGWFWFISFVPYVGGLILLIFMLLDSQRGDNQYGPNPKGIY